MNSLPDLPMGTRSMRLRKFRRPSVATHHADLKIAQPRHLSPSPLSSGAVGRTEVR